jgi:hypothetical protein
LPSERLTERDLEIIDYVAANPGTSKEAIIKELQDRSVSSRVTTFKRIQQLIQDGSIVAQREKPNSQIYKLYISQSDKAGAIMQEIRAFERSFFSHLQKVVNIYNKTNLSDKKEGTGTTKLVIYACGFFYLVIDGYLSLARRIWPIEIDDDETLGRLYSNFFIRIAKMEIRLVNYARHESVVAHAISQSPTSFPWVGPVYSRLLKQYDLYNEFQQVVQSSKSLDLEFLFSQKI